MTAIVQGLAAAAPELGGLALVVGLVWLALLACRRWDRAAARRRRQAIAEARALAAMPGWVTPAMVLLRDGRVIAVHWQSSCSHDDVGQLAALESMMVRSRRAGVR